MAQDAVRFRVAVFGGSAGSLDGIMKIVEALPVDSGAAFIVVVHRRSDGVSMLVELLTSKTNMPVKEVEDKDAIEANCIYIAPADYHLLIEDERTFALDSSEKVHYSRPSIDLTFESVAAIFGKNAIGVLLSGANADGAAGLARIKDAGGYTLVQDPASAEASYMPRQALKIMKPDAIGNVTELPLLVRKALA